MVKRVSLRPYFYIAFAIMVMMFCWESNRIQAAVLDSSIPKDSIRIRILANSDSPQDQWIKRQVQLEVVKEISGWVMDPHDVEEARTEIKANIPELERVVGEVLVANGYADVYQVELGKVPFPAKQYGNKVYPAGNYEALRIVLGSGQGQNWWCVLFPPLCFVGVKAQAAPASAEAAVKTNTKTAEPTNKSAAKNDAVQAGKAADSQSSAAASKSGTEKQQQGAVKATDQTAGNTTAAAAADDIGAPKTEVKFFLWEVVKKVVLMVKSLFA
jgi:stage II sporulation protein R